MKLIHNTIQAIHNLYFGITLPLASLKLIVSHRSLLLLSIFPLILTSVLYYFILTRLNSYLGMHLGTYLASFGFTYDSWLSFLISGILKLILLLISVLTFTFTSTILASPLNDYLAERTEKFVPQITLAPQNSFLKMMRLMYIDFAKSIMLAFFGLIAIVFFWVPILNVVALTLTFLLLSFQYITYPQTRRGLHFRESIVFLKHNFAASLGFGFILFILYSIPFLSSFILPLAVVGGTVLYAEGERKQLIRLNNIKAQTK